MQMCWRVSSFRLHFFPINLGYVVLQFFFFFIMIRRPPSSPLFPYPPLSRSPPLRARLSLEPLCRLRIHGGGRLLHQGHHVALAQDPARHAHRVEGLELGRSMLRPNSSPRSEEHTSELQSRSDLVCRLLLEKK